MACTISDKIDASSSTASSSVYSVYMSSVSMIETTLLAATTRGLERLRHHNRRGEFVETKMAAEEVHDDDAQAGTF